jgi:hypothetical protein
MIRAYEHLHTLKSYRTPLGIRTFARVYIMLTPIIMGPYYSYLAGAGEGNIGVGLPFAMVFSLLQSMAMQGIFSVRVQMEGAWFVCVCAWVCCVFACVRADGSMRRGGGGSIPLVCHVQRMIDVD